jgi:hypothetical protein
VTHGSAAGRFALSTSRKTTLAKPYYAKASPFARACERFPSLATNDGDSAVWRDGLGSLRGLIIDKLKDAAKRSPEGAAMAKKKRCEPRILRQLAEGLIEDIARDTQIADADRADFVTALVRQWTTYDGNAALFIGNRRFYVRVDMARPTQCSIAPESGQVGWINAVCADWKIGPEQLPELIGQLNRGQSAEVTNADGVPVRLWVNPKERCTGIEPLVKQPAPPERNRDCRKIAADMLEQYSGLSRDAWQPLVAGVERQWQEYKGHACLFIGAESQLVLTLTEHGDGNCTVGVQRFQVSLAPLLSTLGIAPLEIPQVIAQINRGNQVEFRNRDGILSVLWSDPRIRRIMSRPLALIPPPAPVVTLPIFCPRCNAFLMVQQPPQLQQACPYCGHNLAHP